MKKTEEENSTPLKTLVNTTQVLVRFSEVDPVGIVWHGHYMVYFEDGREAFGKQYGLSYMEMYNNNYSAAFVNFKIDYKKPVFFGDSVIIETTFNNVKAAKIIFSYKIYRLSDNALVCTAESTQVFINKELKLSFTNPPFFEVWKKKHHLL